MASGNARLMGTLGALGRPLGLLRRSGEGAVNHSQATAGTYAGLFMVSLSALMYEVLLTRIFSVTRW